LPYKLRGVKIGFAGRSARTDRRGKLVIRRRLITPGPYAVKATKRGFVSRRVVVRVAARR